MTATANSLFSTHTDRIEEVLNKNIEMFLPSLDPVWEETVVTNQGVIPVDNIGRDMLYIKTYMGSLAGVIEPDGSVRKDFALYGDNQDSILGTANAGARVHFSGIDNVWPDATKGPNATPYQLAVPMRAMMTNLMMTLGEMQAEATPAFIGEVIGPKMEGFAKNVAHTLCNSWYTSQNKQHRLVQYTGSTVTFDVSAKESETIDIINDTTEGGGVDRFAVGMLVDIYDSLADSGTGQPARLNEKSGVRVRLVVTAVDELAGKVTLTTNSVSDDGTAADDYNLTANDFICISHEDRRPSGGADAEAQRKSFKGIAGIRSWLRTGVTAIDGSNTEDSDLLVGEAVTIGSGSRGKINVNQYPEFKSLGISSVGQLTEHKLRKFLRRFHAAKNKYGQYIDCLVASDGVWLSYEATRIGREQIDRTRALSSVNQGQGSDEGFQFTMDGRTYKGYTSQFIENGVMYGIRKGGQNFKKIVPPSYNGLQNDPRQQSFVPFQFIAGALTGGGNSLPITKSVSNISRVTEGIQMPGMLRMQLVPDQPAGMILEGISTDRTFAG